MLLFCSMVDEEEEERDEEKKREGLERFLEFKDIAELSPVDLTCELVTNNGNSDIRYYPIVRVKSGERIIGATPLNSSEIKDELFRLKNVLERRGYSVSGVYLNLSPSA